MHIFFSGIGGSGIGPIAQIALKAGYSVSGSDKRDSDYIKYLKNNGINDIVLSQTEDSIEKINRQNKIDWFVYTSALTMENPNPPELEFCKKNNIKTSKRDVFLSDFLAQKKLKLIAVAGTHGKTTTTAMIVWLFKQLSIPVSYVLPAKTSFAAMGEYDSSSEYFVYEADEFDRNFLSFNPHVSLITGVSWDHHEIYLTQNDYNDAFKEFISKSEKSIMWQQDYNFLGLEDSETTVLNENDQLIGQIKLLGLYNRRDARLVYELSQVLPLKVSEEKIMAILNQFPGLSRRMEKISNNLYSDYAHTPEKITAALNVAKEMTQQNNFNKLVVIYEPLTNRRQHYIKDLYRDLFLSVSRLYWVPSYLAREDDSLPILSPDELISGLSNKESAVSMDLDLKLKQTIEKHIENNDLVLALSGGGGNSLDEWLRKNFL